MTRELLVVGTRSFAGEVADYCEQAGYRILGLLEPYDASRIGSEIHGLPVLPFERAKGALVALGTGEPDRRPIVERVRAEGGLLTRVVHPGAQVSARSVVGEGTVVGPGAVIGAFSEIGECGVVARGVLVGHHTRIGSFVTLNPGVNVAGNVRIEDDVFLGMAAVVRDHVTVGEGALVAAAAVVLRDVAPGVQVRGLPAAPYQGPEAPANKQKNAPGGAPHRERGGGA